MAKYLNKEGVQYLWQKILGTFSQIGHTHTASDVTDFGTAVDGRITSNWRGQVNGLAPLDGNSMVPASYLPSYVDDVIEVKKFTTSPVASLSDAESGKLYYDTTDKKLYKKGSAGTSDWTEQSLEKGKIYVNLEDNKTYRYGGESSGLVEISKSLAIGTTAGTAYDGYSGQSLDNRVTAIEENYVKDANVNGNTLTLQIESERGGGNVGFTATNDSALTYGAAGSDIDSAIAAAISAGPIAPGAYAVAIPETPQSQS